MEPSKIFGGVTEECHSSESGWTMYIGSPFYGDDGNEHSDHDHHGKNNDDDDHDNGSSGDDDGGKGYNHEDDSDDSMASDASSGPSHQGNTHLKHVDVKEGNGGTSEVEGGLKCGNSRGKKKIDDMRRGGNEEKKREKVVMGKADGDNASAHQSGSAKVRKNLWLGK